MKQAPGFFGKPFGVLSVSSPFLKCKRRLISHAAKLLFLLRIFVLLSSKDLNATLLKCLNEVKLWMAENLVQLKANQKLFLGIQFAAR